MSYLIPFRKSVLYGIEREFCVRRRFTELAENDLGLADIPLNSHIFH